MSLTLNSHSLNLNNITESTTISSLSDYSGTSYSYYSEALNFLKETNSEYRACCRDFYVAVGESTSLEVVNESFADFKDKVRKIIKKFLDFIKRLVDRFITALHKFVSSDKYLKKNQTKFSYFTDADSFDMKKYVYTNIDKENFPNIHALTTFDAEYNKVIETMDSVTAINVKDKLAELDEIYTKFIDGLSSSYDEFRSTVLNPDSESPKGAISELDFDKEIFNIFRDGGDKQNVTVGPDTVTKSWTRFTGYADTIKVVKSNKTQLEKEYKEIQNKLDNIVTVSNGSIIMKKDTTNDKTYSIISNEFTTKLEMYVKGKVDQVVNMTNIHVMAISGKLDALTECYKADKALLYKALSKVQSHKHEACDYLNMSVSGCDSHDAIMDKLLETFRELDYRGYVLAEMYGQTQQSEFLNNVVLEGTGVSVLNEAGAIKNTISRIVQAIGRAYGKFCEFMSKLLKNDKKYLESYKDIILKKPVKEADIDGWYEYETGLQNFVKIAYPAFNYDMQKNSLESEDSWYKAMAGGSGLDLKKNPDVGVTANVLDWLKGAEKTIKSTSLNMTDLFTYVYEFESKTKAELVKDINTINKASENATKLVSSVQPQENNNESAIDNSFVGRYFAEDIKINTPDNAKTTNNSNVPNPAGSVGKVNTNIRGAEDKEEQDKVNATNNDSIKNDASKSAEDQEKVANAINLYFQTGKDILTAKLNFATEVYNAYFKVIRWHVQQYNNNAGKATADSVQKQATNYNQGDSGNTAETIDPNNGTPSGKKGNINLGKEKK